MPTLCTGCGEELKEGAAFCKVCKTLRGASAEEPCETCRAPIHPKATKCTVCGSYKQFGRVFNVGSTMLSAASALVAVLTLAINVYTNRAHSETRTILVGATKEHLLIGYANSGTVPSSVKDFPTVTVDDDVLTIDNVRPHAADQSQLLLKPRDSAVVRYIIGSVTPGPNATKRPFWANYGKTVAHLHVNVVESSGKESRTDDVPLETIRFAIDEKCAPCNDKAGPLPSVSQ